MALNDTLRLADEIAKKITQNIGEQGDLKSGYEYEKLIISAYSTMSIPQIIKAKDDIKRRCRMLRGILAAKTDLGFHTRNDKEIIKAYLKLNNDARRKALTDLEKVLFIIGCVIKKKREIERVKLNAGVINNLVDDAVFMDGGNIPGNKDIRPMRGGIDRVGMVVNRQGGKQ